MKVRGNRVYNLYKALTTTLSPLLRLHLRYRVFLRREHSLRWPERLGKPSLPRPPGTLLCFHAVSLGEGMAAIPVIRKCLEERPEFNVLMTTTSLSAFEVLKNQLPPAVIYQFAPLDLPSAVDAFLSYWKPNAIIFFESELWPNLIMSASQNKITLALLNARMSDRSFQRWSSPVVLSLVNLMLSKFSLIVPLSSQQAIRFQLLQAPPFIFRASADLKYAVGERVTLINALKDIEDLRIQLSDRQAWIAASLHKEEYAVILQAHNSLVQSHPKLLTIIAPRHPKQGLEFAQELSGKGFSVALRSENDKITQETDIYMIDTLGELRGFYRLMRIAVIGGSFLPSLAGHNISEAAASGCAVLIGPHIGHFSHMVSAMQQLNPLSIQKVSEEAELIEVLDELLNDPISLEARQSAAKEAFDALSTGVLAYVWNQLNQSILSRLQFDRGSGLLKVQVKSAL